MAINRLRSGITHAERAALQAPSVCIIKRIVRTDSGAIVRINEERRQATPCQQQQGKAPAPQAHQLAVERVLNDPAASYWLKAAVRATLDRDALDAYRDACTLKDITQARYAYAAGE
jgi:hypothetical protein